MPLLKNDNAIISRYEGIFKLGLDKDVILYFLGKTFCFCYILVYVLLIWLGLVIVVELSRPIGKMVLI